jgi:ribose 5-phosphate isomerase A
MNAPEDFGPVARQALDWVADGQILGLGSGRTANAFIAELGNRVRQGLTIRGVPTSEASAHLAAAAGIPLAGLDDIEMIDVAIDGADEVDPDLNLIKGYGGALVREKIVATAARRFLVLVGQDKLVPRLGSRGRLPVEVIPFGAALCRRRLNALGLPSTIRLAGKAPFVTDNGNWILDCQTKALTDPPGLEQALRALPGVVGTGLFLAMADIVLIQTEEGVQVRERPRA